MQRETLRTRRGTFAKGHRKLGGRGAGVANVRTRALREAIIAAASNLGGNEGLVGFLEKFGRRYPREFTRDLLSKLVPLQISTSDVEDKPKTFDTLEELEAELRRRGLPTGYDAPLPIDQLPKHQPPNGTKLN